MKTSSLGSASTRSTSFQRPVAELGRSFAAGFAATAVKTGCELASPPRAPGVPSPLTNVLDAVWMSATGEKLPEETKAIAEPVVHFLFGTAAGGAYGLLGRSFPRIRFGHGALFGFSFWLAAHEILLPMMGLSPTPAQMTLWEQGNELVSHVLFGLSLESARRAFGAKD